MIIKIFFVCSFDQWISIVIFKWLRERDREIWFGSVAIQNYYYCNYWYHRLIMILILNYLDDFIIYEDEKKKFFCLGSLHIYHLNLNEKQRSNKGGWLFNCFMREYVRVCENVPFGTKTVWCMILDLIWSNKKKFDSNSNFCCCCCCCFWNITCWSHVI